MNTRTADGPSRSPLWLSQLPALLLLLLLLTSLCWAGCDGGGGSASDATATAETGGGGDGGGPGDGGGGDGAGGDGPPHNLDELRVEGLLTLGIGSPATGVQVTGRCGSKQSQTVSDDEGRYAFVSDVKGCTPLVVEFTKESYLPNYRILHLPPPTSPVTVNVPLAALSKLQCGTHRCVVEDSFNWDMPPKPMRQGWVVTMAGAAGLDFVGGEFRQQDGRLIGLVGFAYFDFRDQGGAYLDKFKPEDEFNNCVPVPLDALDWLGDVDSATQEVEMRWYGLDASTGRWISRATPAVVRYTEGNVYTKTADGICQDELDADGNPIRSLAAATRAQLGDIRANRLTVDDPCNVDLDGKPMKKQVFEYWVCGRVDGSGWFGWGIDLPERSCFSLKATDQCGQPLPNVVFSLKGRDHGYRAEDWTDYRGQACLDVVPSEPTGVDYDVDLLGGETFWVDIDLSFSKASLQSILSHKTPQPQSGGKGCADPASCTALEHTFSIYDVVCK